MDHLWTFASEAETFELKDIVAALSEIQVGQHQPKLPTLPCGRKIPKLNSRKFWRWRTRLKFAWPKKRKGELRRRRPNQQNQEERRTRCAWAETISASRCPRSVGSAPAFWSSALSWDSSAVASCLLSLPPGAWNTRKELEKARTTKRAPTSLNCLQALQSLQLLLPCNCSVWWAGGHQRQHRHWPRRWGRSGETSPERWLAGYPKTDVRYDIWHKKSCNQYNDNTDYIIKECQILGDFFYRTQVRS